MPVCILGLAAYFNAWPATSMSLSTARLKAQTVTFLSVLAILFTDSKSPGEDMGKPASIISTPKSSNCKASSNFSPLFSLQPGTCSPSRKVVSKM